MKTRVECFVYKEYTQASQLTANSNYFGLNNILFV